MNIHGRALFFCLCLKTDEKKTKNRAYYFSFHENQFESCTILEMKGKIMEQHYSSRYKYT